MPECRPNMPAQPDRESYPIEALQLTKRLTRAIYQEIYGEQAKPWDKARRIKRWFFTDVLAGSADPANELVEYKVWDLAKGQIVSLAMTKLEASLPNLPGTVVYPKYAPAAETVAVQIGWNEKTAVSGQSLVEPSLAAAVVSEMNAALGAAYRVEPALDPWPMKIVWGTETRRRLTITNGSQAMDAAGVLRERFARGVGSPGNWVLSGSGYPAFVTSVEPDGEQDIRPEIQIPVRSLLANERIEKVGSFTGTSYAIVRTDKTDPTATGFGLTADQAEVLAQIATDVQAVRSWLGADAAKVEG